MAVKGEMGTPVSIFSHSVHHYSSSPLPPDESIIKECVFVCLYVFVCLCICVWVSYVFIMCAGAFRSTRDPRAQRNNRTYGAQRREGDELKIAVCVPFSNCLMMSVCFCMFISMCTGKDACVCLMRGCLCCSVCVYSTLRCLCVYSTLRCLCIFQGEIGEGLPGPAGRAGEAGDRVGRALGLGLGTECIRVGLSSSNSVVCLFQGPRGPPGENGSKVR